MPTERQNQQKIQVLLNLWLRDLTLPSTRSLSEVMDEISAKAEARGLTPEILDSILHSGQDQ